MPERDIVVVKYGSASVSNSEGMDARRVDYYAQNIAALRDKYKFVVVTSGAVAAGRAVWLGIQGEAAEMPCDQALATLGSDECFGAWRDAFRKHDLLTGSVQVTHREIDDVEEGDTLSHVLHENLQHGIIPIINENDALSRLEIAAISYGGDNDGLAQHIATKLWAGHLCLLTDVEGLMDRNGQIVEQVDYKNIDKARELAGLPGPTGRGGMLSKVNAAWRAVEEGVTAHIAHNNARLSHVLAGQIGTHFPVER